ncbi:hypothetical protein JTB14_023846 [Gonioctena quinquepunctata]|nr:hypothetical protein JTB14_023846 [Gonioctena quinquepunctata]
MSRKCIVCEESLDDGTTTSTVQQKGKQSFIDASTNIDLLVILIGTQTPSNVYFLKPPTNRYRQIRCRTFSVHTRIQRLRLDLRPLSSREEAAAQQQTYRVFHVQQWPGNDLPTEELDWRTVQRNLVPITNLKVPAPDKLVKLISCKYQKGCRRLCECDGLCSNQEIIFDEDDDIDDFLESPLSSDNLEEVEVDPPTDESQPCHKRPKLSPLDTSVYNYGRRFDGKVQTTTNSKNLAVDLEKDSENIYKDILRILNPRARMCQIETLVDNTLNGSHKDKLDICDPVAESESVITDIDETNVVYGKPLLMKK